VIAGKPASSSMAVLKWFAILLVSARHETIISE